MRSGKVKESVLIRSILRQLHKKSPYGSPAPGEDAGSFLPDGMEAGRHGLCTTRTVEGRVLAPERLVFGLVNAMTAAGGTVTAVTITILMPPEMEEKELKGLIRRLDELCGLEGIGISAGHTAVSPYVKDLILTGTALGSREEDHVPGKLRPGLDLVAAGPAAMEGTSMIAATRGEALTTRYPASFIQEAADLFKQGDLGFLREVLSSEDVVKAHDLSEGGIFGGLWEMAAADKVGLDIDLRQIPVRQHSIEVCEYFDLNPYQLRSCGSMLIACEKGDSLVSTLSSMGVQAAVIGFTTGDNARLIRYDSQVRYLEPPKMDEYYRLPD